jgi:hypothetical protein
MKEAEQEILLQRVREVKTAWMAQAVQDPLSSALIALFLALDAIEECQEEEPDGEV